MNSRVASPLRRRSLAGIVALAAVATVAACSDDKSTGDSSSGGGAGTAPAVVTFQVAGDEEFKVELVTDELVAHAQALLDGESVAAIPLGTVVRGDPGVNAPWSWHLDPATFGFAEITIEVCDGLPSFVEDETVTSPDYCPWSAQVVALDNL